MISIDEKNIDVAILFERQEHPSLDFSVFIPMRPMLGFARRDRLGFTELGSGVKHLNFYYEWETSIVTGFEVLNSLHDVMKRTGKEDAREALEEFWRQFEGMVFFYGVEELGAEPELAYLSAEDFFREFGVDYRRISTDDANQLLETYVTGIISSTEYQKRLTKKPCNVINLFENKDE